MSFGNGGRKRRAELLKRFELDPMKKARSYSKGNRQKVALVVYIIFVGWIGPLLDLPEPAANVSPIEATPLYLPKT